MILKDAPILVLDEATSALDSEVEAAIQSSLGTLMEGKTVIALRDMIKLICRRTNLSREQAYTLCSLAADLRVTQVVNGNKGIHVMLDKAYLARGA